ncbi:hypothetical protein TUSST3_22750 [Streptomyces sp. TUS-ST3]|jgi:hypothetical protein|uniref:hypothetical protein n=1 Tax=Streptomyces sp. TUS-ST3 TaxID=3025591 RepID=UPI00235B3358|nr:hypothetical protein [Streptomyces sp. TUS-ST3]GLP65655.1 hypothetical protein TUSST3_22750 [Streptomyces sp. TUS-ST3]
MGPLLPLVIVVGALVVVLGLFAALAGHVRRRGTAGGALRGALAAHDEAFHGTAADSYHEIQVQTDRRTPLPDDRWKRGPRSGRRA